MQTICDYAEYSFVLDLTLLLIVVIEVSVISSFRLAVNSTIVNNYICNSEVFKDTQRYESDNL